MRFVRGKLYVNFRTFYMQNCRRLVLSWQLKLFDATRTAIKLRIAPKCTLPAGENFSMQLNLPAAGVAGNFHTTPLLAVHRQNVSFSVSFSWFVSELYRRDVHVETRKMSRRPIPFYNKFSTL